MFRGIQRKFFNEFLEPEPTVTAQCYNEHLASFVRRENTLFWKRKLISNFAA